MTIDQMEILRPDLPRGRFRFALFDFDGTLSLIREGWPQVMIPMMVDVLAETIHAFPSTSRILNGLFADARRALEG